MHGHMNVKFLTDVSGQPLGPVFEGQESKK
jgi:hypothetical protein